MRIGDCLLNEVKLECSLHGYRDIDIMGPTVPNDLVVDELECGYYQSEHEFNFK